MKKTISILLAAVMILMASGAFAAGKVETKQENFYVITGWSTYAYAFARVENTGNKPINVNAGVLEAYGEDGDVITSSTYLSTYAYCLQPGEYTYTSISGSVENPEQTGVPVDYLLTITGRTDDTSSTLRLPVESTLSLGEGNGWSKTDYVYATVTNNTEDVAYNISVVYAVLDDAGNILYVNGDNLYSSRGLTPGSSMVFRMDISSSFSEYFEANNIVPTAVDVIAYINK